MVSAVRVEPSRRRRGSRARSLAGCSGPDDGERDSPNQELTTYRCGHALTSRPYNANRGYDASLTGRETRLRFGDLLQEAERDGREGQ
jgi:hypothetical protein